MKRKRNKRIEQRKRKLPNELFFFSNFFFLVEVSSDDGVKVVTVRAVGKERGGEAMECPEDIDELIQKGGMFFFSL